VSSSAPVALYVHVPFCLSVCPYCDFVVYAGRSARGSASAIDRFVAALLNDIELRAADAAHACAGRLPPLASVYLGGGTPSLLAPLQVERILAACDAHFGIAAGAEVTLEANPGEGERGDLRGFRAAGVNRLSIGAQSLQPAELRRLGRRHSPADVATTVRRARAAAFDNLSLDLLYDVPGQTLDSWRATLAATVALTPDHISAYALSLDDPTADGLTGPDGDHLPPSAGAQRWRERARPEQDEDFAAACYELADDAFSRAGLAWYEISNWARPDRFSRHNLAYWLGGAYEAVGPGAHAFDGGRRRRWNGARLDRYLAALLPGDGSPAGLPPGADEIVEPDVAESDRLILRLRTAAGLPPDEARRAGLGEALEWGRANGLLKAASGAWQLTRRGRLLSSELFDRV